MRKVYQSYAEIPVTVREYILTVADKKTIMDIPLEEINSFLEGMDEFYANQKEELIDDSILHLR
jgi:hypothetical protein